MLLVRDIATLLTMQGDDLGRIDDAAILVDGERVHWLGRSVDLPSVDVTDEIDASGCVVLPGLVDCHTHAVWAGSRATEFEKRLAGAAYSDILEAGGGIHSTVRATRAASDSELVDGCARRLQDMLRNGVTTVEIKGGYGLTVRDERRLLVAAREAGKRVGVDVFTSWLGAHTLPGDRSSDVYVEQLIAEQLPAVVDVADFVDAYIDRGAFTLEQGRRVLEAGKAAGLGVRVHAEQVDYTGAAEMAARLGALSADHLERLDGAGIAAMAEAGTTAVLLPGAMLYLRDTPPPVEALREAGVPMAVATDLNPGSSPVRDLWACATLACITMGLTVTEALRGITVVAARSLGVQRDLRAGAQADLVVAAPPPGEPPEPAVLIQYLGAPAIRAVVRRGVRS